MEIPRSDGRMPDDRGANMANRKEAAANAVWIMGGVGPVAMVDSQVSGARVLGVRVRKWLVIRVRGSTVAFQVSGPAVIV